MPVEVDAEALWSDITALAQIGADPQGGVSRVAWTPADMQGRAWVQERMAQLGMAVRMDAAGNVIGRVPGTGDPAGPAIALGSHTDTVPQGGRFDGALGVLAAIHVLAALMKHGMRLRHTVEVIDFACEEAVYGSGTLGCLAMVGKWNPAALRLPAGDDGTLEQRLAKAAGLDPARMGLAARPEGELAAFLELHPEQGPVLIASGEPIGVVSGIVGIRRAMVSFSGMANHAGTTPMDRRQDALVHAARFVVVVPEIARRRAGMVATVGQLQVHPGSPAVIPSRVDLSVDLRGLDPADLAATLAELQEAAAAAGGTWQMMGVKAAVQCAPHLQQTLMAACHDLGLTHRVMPSGAGHDAMVMAEYCPVAMLFVPSVGGISHAPTEWTEAAHCAAGAQVLLAALLRLDRA